MFKNFVSTIVKPESEVPKSKIPRLRPKGIIPDVPGYSPSKS